MHTPHPPAPVAATKDDSMEVTAYLNIKIPKVPNFFIINGDSKETLSLSVSSFTDEELQNVANKWRDKLIANALRQRINEAAAK